MEKEKQKIYIVGLYTGRSSYGIIQDAGEDGDIIGYAMIKDGNMGGIIASHLCSGFSWLKRDMGLIGSCKHDIYKKLFGDNYELVFGGTFKSEKELDDWCGLMFGEKEVTTNGY